MNNENLDLHGMRLLMEDYRERFGSDGTIVFDGAIMHKWEYQLLKTHGGIGRYGILSNYPVMKISTKDNNCSFKDFGGDYEVTKKAVDEFNSLGNKDKASVYYYPKTYITFSTVKKLQLEIEMEKFKHIL